MSQNIEYTWIGAYLYCRKKGLRLAKFNTNRQFSQFRGLITRLSYFPKIYIDAENSKENVEISCKVSSSSLFPHVKIPQKFCDTSKGAFVCENVSLNEAEVVAENVESKIVNEAMNFIGEFGKFLE